MKRYLIIILAGFALFACSDDYRTDRDLYPNISPRYLRVSPTSLKFTSEASGTSQSLTIKSMETPWSIDNGIQWIRTSPTSGDKDAQVFVGVQANEKGDPRTGIFYLRSEIEDWSFEKPISITQSGAEPQILLSQTEINFAGGKNTARVTVTANCTWKATCSADWLTVTTEDSTTIFIAATENVTASYRQATVIVSHTGENNKEEKIIVKQAPASVTASTDSLVFNNQAGAVTITIEAESAWTASSSDSWIEVSPTSGKAGTSSMRIEVSPNPSISERIGYVILSIGENQRIQIPVYQNGLYVKAKQSTLNFDSEGGDLSLEIESNTSWGVTTDTEWITLSDTEGNGNQTITVTAEENLYTADRSGLIVLTQEGTTLTYNVEVNQRGKTFDITTTVLDFNADSSSQTVHIETNGTWFAHTSTEWITISPETATGNTYLTVTVTENLTDEERSGEIIVTMGDKSSTIAVVQAGKYFTVSNTLLKYSSKGGAIQVSISTNGDWSAEVESAGSSWLSLSQTSGTGNIEVTITATDNPSVNKRTSSVYFSTPYNDRKVCIKVTQDARYLTVDMNEILFYAKGGSSEPITVSTDGEFSIQENIPWLAVHQETENTFFVEAMENTTSRPRFGTIVLALTDLEEGSYTLTINVIQLNEGMSFLRREFEEDSNWDNEENLLPENLLVKPFGLDNNYDSSSQPEVKLKITGYSIDKNWDDSGETGVTVSKTEYNSDKNLDM